MNVVHPDKSSLNSPVVHLIDPMNFLSFVLHFTRMRYHNHKIKQNQNPKSAHADCCKWTLTEILWDSLRVFPKLWTLLERVVTSWQSTGTRSIHPSLTSGLWDSVTVSLLYPSDVTKPSPISPFQNFLSVKKGAFPAFLQPGSSMKLTVAVKQSLSQITCT